jgi:hypothetical protein
MFRRTAVVAIGVLALSAVSMSGAGALTTPAKGTLACSASGSIGLKPALTNTPAPKPITVSAKKQPVADCDASGVTGGKAPITNGTIDLSTKLPPSSSCLSLASGGTLPPMKITLKLVNTSIVNGKTKSVTVATVKPTNVVAALDLATISLNITGDIPDNPTHTKAFGGEHFSASLVVTNAADLAGCLTGTPITTIQFAGPVSIAP